jgi:DNA-directed RNA polymerase specialized sigma24 family protein
VDGPEDRRHPQEEGATDDGPDAPHALVPLLVAAQRGDPVACARLLTAFHAVALAEARLLLRARAAGAITPEDIAQEALLRVFLHLGSCRASTTPGLFAWLLVIVRRTSAELTRGSAARVAAASVDLDEVELHGAISDEVSPKWAELHGFSMLLRLAVRAYDEDLDDVAAGIIWSHLVAASSWSEIAADVGATTSATKRRFQRAQLALRRGVLRRVGGLPPEARAGALRELARIGAVMAVAELARLHDATPREVPPTRRRRSG